MICPTWPLGRAYKVINFDRPMTAGLNSIIFGPQGPAGADMAWVIFNLTFSYNAPVIPGGYVTPFYQDNQTVGERGGQRRVTLAKFPTDYNIVFPIIGGGSAVEDVTMVRTFRGQERPLYLPFPDELIINIDDVPVGGRNCQLRGLVLEVPLNVDISTLM